MAYQRNTSYYMVSHAGAGKCLNVYGNEQVSNNRNVCLWSKSTGKAQSWSIMAFTAGDKIVSGLSQTYALNYYWSAGQGNAGNCDIYPQANNDQDSCITLVAVNTASNIYKIKLKNYNLYLTAKGTGDNADVRWESPVTTDTTQQWKLDEFSSESIGDSGLGQAITSTAQYSGLTEVDLIARCIFSEAGNQGDIGQRGVACVLRNRKEHRRFPNSYREVILQENQFSGMNSHYAMRPDTSSANWIASVAVAKQIATVANPIGTCTFFKTNSSYNNNIVSSGPPEVIYFSGANLEVLEKKVIGNHTFFRVEGY